jgi:pyruvate,water dikinase
MGRRIAENGFIAQPQDVSWLKLDELRDAFRQEEEDGDFFQETINRRKAERAWIEAHPGPAVRGEPPPPMPDLRAVPREARRINEAFQWFMSMEYPTITDQDSSADGEAVTHRQTGGTTEEPILSGLPGAPGSYQGPVRVVRSEKEFDRVRPGDVLVCRVTTPTWSVLFGRVGAVVTDGGSPVAHAGIVAREHGIPAVVATERGTDLLHDGQIVNVDGREGIVREKSRASSG